MIDPIFSSTDLFLRDFGPRRIRHDGLHWTRHNGSWLRHPEARERARHR